MEGWWEEEGGMEGLAWISLCGVSWRVLAGCRGQ